MEKNFIIDLIIKKEKDKLLRSLDNQIIKLFNKLSDIETISKITNIDLDDIYIETLLELYFNIKLMDTILEYNI